MSTEANKTNKVGLPREMNVLVPEDQASSGLQTDYMGPTAGGPATKVYVRALCDIILRTIFAVAILAVGCWIPASYLEDISWYWMDPDPVVRLASVVSKVAACIYGVIACWSFRCVFETLDRIETKSTIIQ